MATKTQAEFRDIVLGHLNVLAAGEVPSAEDAVKANDVIEAVNAELMEVGLAYWPEDEIPVAVIGAYKRVVAADLAHDFLTAQEAAVYESKRQAGINRIRAVTATVAPSLPNMAVYF